VRTAIVEGGADLLAALTQVLAQAIAHGVGDTDVANDACMKMRPTSAQGRETDGRWAALRSTAIDLWTDLCTNASHRSRKRCGRGAACDR
jgi:hypothetical protein